MQRGCLHCNGTDSWEGKRHILSDIIVMGKCERPLKLWSLCLLYVLLMPLIHCIRAFSDNMATHKYVTWKLHAKTYLLKRRCVRTSSQKRATAVWFSQVTTTHEQPLIFAFFVVPREVDSTQFFFLPSQRGDKSSSNKQNILVMSLFNTLVMIFIC